MFMPSIFGDTFFDGLFDDFSRPARRGEAMLNVPTVMKTDVIEAPDSYELHIDLPGYKKEDVKAELKEGYLTITASFTDSEEKKEKKYLRRERYFGSCSRSFYVGENVEKEDIKAKFNEGVLELTVPKKEAKPKIEENHFIAIE